MYIEYKHMLANLWALGGHTYGPTHGHTIDQLQWYILPEGNIRFQPKKTAGVPSYLPHADSDKDKIPILDTGQTLESNLT